MSKRIYDLVNKNKETKTELIYGSAYLYFWHNEACRHKEDIISMQKDVALLEQVIVNRNRQVIDVEVAKAMKRFLEIEMDRHVVELTKIEENIQNHCYGGDNIVMEIPAIRVDVD